VLARLGCCQGDLGMAVVWGGDINDIDGWIRDDGPPVAG